MNSKISKIFASVLMLAVLLIMLPVQANADTTTSYQGKIVDASSISWSPYEDWSLMSYSALSELCVSFNTDPGWDTVFGLYLPGIDLVNKSATIVQHGKDIFYIQIYQSGKIYVLCNQFGFPFYAQSNPDSILSSIFSSAEIIRVNLQNLYNQQATHFSNVLKQLTNFQTVIDADISNLGAKLRTIVEQSTKINTQFRDFVNGHTVDDIITAIGNISVSVGDVTVDSYDDTKLLATLGCIETQLGQVITGLSSVETAIKNIPSTDNTGILAALGRIETKLGDLNITGGSTDLTPVTAAIAALNENISKISTHAADRLFGVSVLPDTDGLSYVNGEFTYSVVEGTPFYTVSDPVDFEFLSDSSSALTTDHIYLPDPAETDTLMFVIDSSLAGLGLGDTLHNYLNNLFFSVYSGSGVEFMVSGSDFTPTTDGKFVYYLEFDGSDYFWLEVHDGGWLPGCFFAYPAQRVGESSSSGTMTFYANGTRYSFTLVDRSGTACPLTSTVYDNGDILTSTVLRDADGLWRLTVSDGTNKILSADLCKRLDAALTGQETLTWFSWFYNYSAAFQSWLGDKLSGISTGSGGSPGSGSSGSTVDLTAVIASVDAVGVHVTDMDAHFSANLDSLVDKLQIIVDNSQTSVDNVTNVVIDQTNNAYNVFYVTGEDGQEHSIGEVTGNTLSASGKLLNFLYKLCVEGALSKVDDSISGMNDFYFDSGTGTEGSIWD